MKRWNYKLRVEVEKPQMDGFIDELIAVCKKHGFSIGHEDAHGAFEITAFNDHHAEWLKHAADNT